MQNGYLNILHMDINELLQFVDKNMFAKSGKHLNDLQRQVIEGVLNHQKYVDIADTYARSEGHVKDVGYELLQLLSDIFEEPVSKANLQSVLERQKNINFTFGDRSVQMIGCVNFGSSDFQTLSDKGDNKNETSLHNKELTRIEKLKKRGLSDEEIAEVLEIPLEVLKNFRSTEI